MTEKISKTKIVLATNNKGKVSQFFALFKPLNNVAVLTTADVGFNTNIDETGTTFEENSLIKAQAVHNHIANNTNLQNYVIVSEDGGLCINYLGGEPGVFTARFGGDNLSREERLNFVLNKLTGAKDHERTAEFVAVVTAMLPSGEFKQYKGVCKGQISKEIIEINKGLGMAPIFILDANNKALSQLTDDEVIKLNHRGNAVRFFINDFNNFVK